MPKWLLFTFVIVGFLGFLDATYLTVEHYLGVIPPCYVADGCELVLTSEYATVAAGVPNSLLGSLYYLTITLIAIFFWDTRSKRALIVLGFLPIVGLMASVWFVYLQLFVIKAVCFYCMVSAILSAILFLASAYLLKLIRKNSFN